MKRHFISLFPFSPLHMRLIKKCRLCRKFNVGPSCSTYTPLLRVYHTPSFSCPENDEILECRRRQILRRRTRFHRCRYSQDEQEGRERMIDHDQAYIILLARFAYDIAKNMYPHVKPYIVKACCW